MIYYLEVFLTWAFALRTASYFGSQIVSIRRNATRHPYHGCAMGFIAFGIALSCELVAAALFLTVWLLSHRAHPAESLGSTIFIILLGICLCSRCVSSPFVLISWLRSERPRWPAFAAVLIILWPLAGLYWSSHA